MNRRLFLRRAGVVAVATPLAAIGVEAAATDWGVSGPDYHTALPGEEIGIHIVFPYKDWDDAGVRAREYGLAAQSLVRAGAVDIRFETERRPFTREVHVFGFGMKRA